jgi:hypothetical protein
MVKRQIAIFKQVKANCAMAQLIEKGKAPDFQSSAKSCLSG